MLMMSSHRYMSTRSRYFSGLKGKYAGTHYTSGSVFDFLEVVDAVDECSTDLCLDWESR